MIVHARRCGVSLNSMMANGYSGLTELQVSQLFVHGDSVEICSDNTAKIQK